MRVHFISIGGSAMHSLAIALKKNGDQVSGSDDEIFEPSKTRLEKYGILPQELGWHPELITKEIEAVILGMHARENNPELLKAKELGVPIYSYPEYIYQRSIHKKRIVIGGSHGKTTCTAMIMHVLRICGIEFDYLVGASLEGFSESVKITDTAPLILIEGDEYLSSPIDRRPKFILYQANIALLTGIAWDHINVFPTFEIYKKQFIDFLDSFSDQSTLIYCAEDQGLEKLVMEHQAQTKSRSVSKISHEIPYFIPRHQLDHGKTVLINEEGAPTPLKVFGHHNLLNIEGSRLICQKIGVNNADFLQAISSFKGASRRLELLHENENTQIFTDFAHAPSKIKATLSALKELSTRTIWAIMELHTYSSLNTDFMDEYKGSMQAADHAIVYFNPNTLIHKKLPPLSAERIRKAFDRSDLIVMDNSLELRNFLLQQRIHDSSVVFMSSGNFDEMDLKDLSLDILKN